MKACPTGWHLPSDAEWTTLSDFVGSNSGTKLKAKGSWYQGGNGTDDYGFSALPGGQRNYYGSFIIIGKVSNWWSSTEIAFSNAWFREAVHRNGSVGRYNSRKEVGFSVRCIRDN